MRRIKRHIPKIRTSNRHEDSLYESGIVKTRFGVRTTYFAKYNCRGVEREMFVAKTEEGAIKHFLAVSEGDIPPMPTVEGWDKMHVDENVANNVEPTMDLFRELPVL